MPDGPGGKIERQSKIIQSTVAFPNITTYLVLLPCICHVLHTVRIYSLYSATHIVVVAALCIVNVFPPVHSLDLVEANLLLLLL